MKTKHAVWLAFFLNLSYAIVEFITGGLFGSSAVLADSVLSIRITLSTNQDITGISSQYYTFTEDPSSANTYIGTPTSGTITAGETLNMTINVATSSPVTTFLVSSYYFDWND